MTQIDNKPASAWGLNAWAGAGHLPWALMTSDSAW